MCAISGCVFLQGGGNSSEQDFHCQSKGGANTGARQNQYFLVSNTLCFCVLLVQLYCEHFLKVPVSSLHNKPIRYLCVCLSFGRLCDMVDHVFPLLDHDEEAGFRRSDTFDQSNYWGKHLPDETSQEEEVARPLETSWGNPIWRGGCYSYVHVTGRHEPTGFPIHYEPCSLAQKWTYKSHQVCWKQPKSFS